LESTPRIKLGGSINERFDDPIPNLEEVSSRGRHTVRKVDQISNAHGDSDSVDAQRLKAGDIALIEPGFPMSPEPVIDGVRVRLSESAVSSKKRKSIWHQEPKNLLGTHNSLLMHVEQSAQFSPPIVSHSEDTL
jgi:hypothetical protein